MSDCIHPMRYRPFALGPWFCPVCSPPSRTPRSYGILQEDGSVLSMAEAAARRRAIIQSGAERDALAQVRGAWPDGEWEVVQFELGRDGWPKNSFPGVTLPKIQNFLLGASPRTIPVVG